MTDPVGVRTDAMDAAGYVAASEGYRLLHICTDRSTVEKESRADTHTERAQDLRLGIRTFILAHDDELELRITESARGFGFHDMWGEKCPDSDYEFLVQTPVACAASTPPPAEPPPAPATPAASTTDGGFGDLIGPGWLCRTAL